MRILLLGASGFIGSELARALQQAGHTVTGLGRDMRWAERTLPGLAWIEADLRDLRRAEDWHGHLAGIDQVINASGVLQTGLRDNIETVQLDAIQALLVASKSAGLSHFIQISASNADPVASNRFMATKGVADASVAASGLSYTVLRPGLVIGRNAFGGTEMLRMTASLPLVLPDIEGTGSVQCVAMSDLVEAVLRSVENPDLAQGSFDLVEAQGHPLVEVTALHRRWLGLAPARWNVGVPRSLLRPATLLADALGWLGWRSPLRSNSIAALMNGVSGDSRQAAALLGREPLGLAQTLDGLPAAGKADRWHARTALAYPLALGTLFILFLASGILGLLRVEVAAGLLKGSGTAANFAQALVIAGSLADIAAALALLLRRTTRAALIGMLALSLGYVAGSLILAPELWLDPLGPMLKVLPVAALILLCLGMADER